jgi:hypothetical protein
MLTDLAIDIGDPGADSVFGAGKLDLGADPDTTSPAAPTGLAPAAGDGQVDLDWDDNAEPDLAGYNVHRSTTSGGPYSQLNGAPVASSAFTDSTAANGVEYFYVVTAEDLSGNESGDSDEVSATPQSSGGQDPTSLHVDSIVPFTVNIGRGNKHGRADVTVVDDLGNPVAGADVTGTFSGDFSETLMASTDGSGVAVLQTSATARGGIQFTLCVDDVSHGLPYESADNVVTCASN